MKISVNSIRTFNEQYGCAGDPAPDGVDKLVERIGAQLAAVEAVTRIGDKYKDVVIVRIVECRKHENSDHLHVCSIDDGGMVLDVERMENGRIQVVCGAQNVRAGQTVAWLPPGATVPSTYDSEPFVLSVREIRGETSNGMLASPKELALGDSHDGILEIEEDIAPGTKFADYYQLTDDAVIDMENKMFTHRPDCFGMLGIAREIAGIQGRKFTSPEWYRSDAHIDAPEEATLKVTVRNEIPELVPRFAVVPISGIHIRPSPLWLQIELVRMGVRPINNVVDLTNYYMLLTGQPLHAYDYDKVVAAENGADHATIVIRHPHKSEKLTLLNGKTIELSGSEVLIASGSKAIGLGGVMGGGDTEVDDTTTNIILESATFDMYSIRRTSMEYGIFSDAVSRFNKGQSPLQNTAVLARAAEDIVKIAGGTVAGQTVDDNHIHDNIMKTNTLHAPDAVEASFVNSRLGLDLSGDEMLALLENVEFQGKEAEGTIQVKPPFWRTDIEIAEDIVEEIGRLYGYDRLPLKLPMRDLTPAAKNPAFNLQSYLRRTLSSAGANEVLNYSFVPGSLLEKTGQDKNLAYTLSNALSPELQYYRLSLTPSLLTTVHTNIKAGYNEFGIFEIGKSHITDEVSEDGLPRELDRLAFIYAVDDKKAAAAYAGAAFYQVRTYLLALFCSMPYTFVPLSEISFEGNTALGQLAAPFEPSRSAGLSDGTRFVGVIGEYNAGVRKALKLPKFCAGFEIDQACIPSDTSGKYQMQPRYPKVIQDICLKVPDSVPYLELHDFVRDSLGQKQPEGTVTTLAPIDIFRREADREHKQITFRFSIASYERTLTDAEVAAMLSAVADQAADKFGAERV